MSWASDRKEVLVQERKKAEGMIAEAQKTIENTQPVLLQIIGAITVLDEQIQAETAQPEAVEPSPE